MAALLISSGKYRVLRVVEPVSRFSLEDGSAKRIGVVMDLETTGLDTATDVPIELGILRFEYSQDGRIFGVLDGLSTFIDPSRPIPPAVSELTGITDDMVRGHQVDPHAIS